ncbi:MAG: ATP-binding protein [Planctomycetes bacterium]|nr:ATP-binding protein [Planctomycetota bacterium]
MATARQIKALLESYAEGDESRFLTVAMQVAAHEARAGHGQLALELKELVDKARLRSSQPVRPIEVEQVVQLHKPQGELASLLQLSYPKTRLSDMVLAPALRNQVERVLIEQHQQGKLRERGLAPRHKLLLVGPPGSGKTMTANALAGELGLALFTIKLDGVITRFLGETSAKLRLVFEALARTRGVYLFDEFDAIGGQRAATNDIGEARRILNSFLQFMDEDASESLIIAATNHAELLDRALFRRFDDVIEYDLPSRKMIEKTMRARLASFPTGGVNWSLVNRAADGLSYADVSRACEEAAKEFVLTDSTEVSTEMLVGALHARGASKPASDGKLKDGRKAKRAAQAPASGRRGRS